MLKKNDKANIPIPIGKDTYPNILWAIFQVLSSLIVQGNLNPIYLLKGILGAIFPKNIINIEHKPTTKISLVLGFNELLIGDNIENIQPIM